MLRERSQSFKLAFIGLDLVVSLAAVFSALVLHFWIVSPEKRIWVMSPPGEPFAQEYALVKIYFPLILLITFTQVIVFIATDLYHPRRGQSFLREFVAIVRGVILNFGLVLALLFFYRSASFSRLMIAYTAFFMIFYHTVGHYAFRYQLQRLRARGYNTRNVLILGTGATARRFADSLRRHSIYGFRILGFVGPLTGVPEDVRPLVLGPMRDFKKIAALAKADMIVYALPADQKGLSMVVDYCDQEGIDCRIIPDWVEMITSNARIEAMDGIPVMTVREVPLKNGYNKFVKRLFDIVFSLTVLVLTFPALALLALIIKLTSPGPVFFSQERMGLDRKNFKIYKFRTMRVQAETESNTTWGTKEDTRVTRIGRIMRKASLDELPQFVNVLLGDMSVVGPRPERPHFVSQFKSRYAHYMRRHAVKSGITGWAQIQGFRGDTSIEKRAEADIYYIENWTFWLDLIIVLRTVPSLVKNPGE